MPDAAKIEPRAPHLETTHFYDDLSRHYHLIYQDWSAVVRREAAVVDSLLRRFAPDFRSPEQHRVLDCAAGIGTQALGLWGLGYDILASDLSRRSLAMLQEHAAGFQPRGAALSEVETRIEDFCTLARSFAAASFDSVICMDNAVAHMLTREDLRTAVRSMASVLAERGIILLSLRPYDELQEARPTFHPEAPRFKSERMYFQVWRWLGRDLYDSHFFLILSDDRVLNWRTRFRAIGLREVREAFDEIGFEAIALSPEDSGYFQPVVVARCRR